MSSFPGSPKLQKGAIVGIDPFNPLASVIVFQYNPEKLTRTLQVQSAGDGGGGFSEAQRLKGAPVEMIKVDVEIDATDQLETAEENATNLGIYPQLSALEMLAYPKSALVITNTVLLALGTIEIVPPTGPLVLFVWGLKRVLPVRLNDFSINEEAFDVNLNPIRAQVSLGLRVLSYNDVPLVHPAHGLFLAHQVVKEAFATISSVNNLSALKGLF
ncbi:MAG TPA: hypothetical protein VIC84_08705 [Blastocatellia bacterium]|jgi:hypothetical protein